MGNRERREKREMRKREEREGKDIERRQCVKESAVSLV